MAGDDRRPRAWHDVHTVQEAPRERQKSSGRIAAAEAAARKKIDALRAQRLAREAEQAQASSSAPKATNSGKSKG